MRAALRLRQAAATAPLHPYRANKRAGKLTTGLHGVPIHPSPLPALLSVYKATLSSLQTKIPQGVVYRQAAEALTEHRMQVVEKHAGKEGTEGGEEAVEAVERELDAGVIEEVIKVAEGEQKLVEQMAEWKA